jgi:outer membrane receptor for ferrienterochelin and colicin
MKKIFVWISLINILLIILVPHSLSQEKSGGQNYFELSLEELGQIQVTAGSLLLSEKKYSPSSVMLITREMIESSGSRNLIEVLSTFIPSFHNLKHPALSDRIGMNGMVSDLNDKILFLVNGKIMNSQPLLGISSEFDLSMLGDIEKIEVVNGPGSATYGSGAINGVICITARDADNFDGLELIGKLGFIEKYSTAEIQWAGKVPLGGKLYIYSGIDNYKGSPSSNSPIYFGSTFSIKGTGTIVQPETAVDLKLLNDNASDLDLRPKIFIDYKINGFNTWIRYTEGGTSGMRNGRSLLIQNGITEYPDKYKSIYRQLSAVLNYEYFPISDLLINAQLSFDRMRNSWYLRIPSNYESSEKKYSGKITAKWNISNEQSIAAGIEFTHGLYTGLLDAGSGVKKFSWNTNYYAFLVEHSWNFLSNWHSNITARIDKRTLTEYVFSPRLALIYEPIPASCFTLSWSRSNRLGDEYYNQYYRSLGIISKPGIEKVETFQFRYNQLLSEALMAQTMMYQTNQDVLAWDHVKKIESMQGNINYYGIEILVNYRTNIFDIVCSHAYNKLSSIDLSNSNIKTLISSSPYGYGEDFHMVPRHISKMNINLKIIENLTIFTSLQKIWYYEGSGDFANYNQEVLKNSAYTLTDKNYNYNFDGPTTLNGGVIYKFYKDWNIYLKVYNALGWFDKDFSKQRYYSNMDVYRTEASAYSIETKICF